LSCSITSRLLDHVELHGHQALLDELLDLGVRVRHGTHHPAATSPGVEQIDQDELSLPTRFLPRLLKRVAPLDILTCHRFRPSFDGSLSPISVR
jgi:hypothetical protein